MYAVWNFVYVSNTHQCKFIVNIKKQFNIVAMQVCLHTIGKLTICIDNTGPCIEFPQIFYLLIQMISNFLLEMGFWMLKYRFKNWKLNGISMYLCNPGVLVSTGVFCRVGDTYPSISWLTLEVDINGDRFHFGTRFFFQLF